MRYAGVLVAVGVIAAVIAFVLASEPAGPPAKRAASGCALDLGHLRAARCRLLKSDTAAGDPLPLWGRLDCANAARQQVVSLGGDPHPTGNGLTQGNKSYRHLTVLDGDWVFGERCELGANEYRPSFSRTFALYHEGDHRVTFMSLRLPPRFPIATSHWQLVMQMKQTQPSDNGNGTPVLSLQVENGRWRLFHSSSVEQSGDSVELWSAPAATGQWTRFAFDVVYSQKSDTGKIRVYADLNGDGDTLDPGEQSPLITTYTLKRETAAETNPDRDPIPAGASIPSHLRIGIYHNPEVPCPAPAGCPVDVDNVQVYAVP